MEINDIPIFKAYHPHRFDSEGKIISPFSKQISKNTEKLVKNNDWDKPNLSKSVMGDKNVDNGSCFMEN